MGVGLGIQLCRAHQSDASGGAAMKDDNPRSSASGGNKQNVAHGLSDLNSIPSSSV